MDFWVKHAASMCKHVSQVMRDELLPHHDDEEDRKRFLFGGKDIRDKVRQDVAKLKKLMEPDLEVKLFGFDGRY